MTIQNTQHREKANLVLRSAGVCGVGLLAGVVPRWVISPTIPQYAFRVVATEPSAAVVFVFDIDGDTPALGQHDPLMDGVGIVHDDVGRLRLPAADFVWLAH